MSLHIYRAASQPATLYVDRHGPQALWTLNDPRKKIRAFCCRKLRWAKYLTVQVYYDSIMFWCREGCGCKAK